MTLSFSLIYLILAAALGLGVYSAFNRNEYQKLFLEGKARPESKADNLIAIFLPID
jgi:hypothetical protein